MTMLVADYLVCDCAPRIDPPPAPPGLRLEIALDLDQAQTATPTGGDPA